MQIGEHGGVAFGKFHQLRRVGDVFFEGLDHGDAVGELLALAHQFLGFLRVVPEFRALGQGGQFIEAFCGCIPVKDASVAKTTTGGSDRSGSGFRRTWGLPRCDGNRTVGPAYIGAGWRGQSGGIAAGGVRRCRRGFPAVSSEVTVSSGPQEPEIDWQSRCPRRRSGRAPCRDGRLRRWCRSAAGRGRAGCGVDLLRRTPGGMRNGVGGPSRAPFP